MDIRLRFEKSGKMAYLGHLDLMRYFQKALRRAHIPLEFSKGFHPHPVMSFAQPLSVGVTSSCEYVDIRLKENMEPGVLKSSINAAMHEGVFIHDVFVLPEKSPNAMSLVSRAEYIVYFRDMNPVLTREVMEEAVDELLGQSEIIVEKNTKKGSKSEDIRPLIFGVRIVDIKECEYPGFRPFDAVCERGVFLDLKTGSQGNLPAQTVAEVLLKRLNVLEYTLGIHRAELYL